jgi:hypothetical protein
LTRKSQRVARAEKALTGACRCAFLSMFEETQAEQTP